MYENHILAPGTQARIIREYPKVNLGEVVTIIKYDANKGYLVCVNVVREKVWLPAYVISNPSQKPWNFRFKKPPRTLPTNGNIPESPQEGPVPDITDRLQDLVVQAGSKIVLCCRIRGHTPHCRQSWKKLEPNLCILRNGRFMMEPNGEGVALLTLDNAKPSDSGTYSFTIANEYGSASCSCVVSVTGGPGVLVEPTIQVLSSTSVQLDWDNPQKTPYYVEHCKLGSGEWTSPSKSVITESTYVVDDLVPGETYSFRLVSSQTKAVSLPSVAVTLPIGDNLLWQQEQFRRRYMELEEISRGRFSIVRLAKDRGTNVEVALKQITRRKQAHQVTQAEYALLAGMEHPNIIRSLALFDNAPVPGIDTIVLELVRGPLLFASLSERGDYLEGDVRLYTRQLMSALAWLHRKNVSHLDVKPENVMVDITFSPPLLKLVDFGDSVNTTKNVILPPACLEFASPELVLGQPVGKHTDCWAAGVFLYVLLSGVSPFLDDSMEETTANILKCDYCFPDEYFAQITEPAKDLIKSLLVLAPAQRMDMDTALTCSWIRDEHLVTVIPCSRLKTFMQRRHPVNISTTPTSPVYTGEHIF